MPTDPTNAARAVIGCIALDSTRAMPVIMRHGLEAADLGGPAALIYGDAVARFAAGRHSDLVTMAAAARPAGLQDAQHFVES